MNGLLKRARTSMSEYRASMGKPGGARSRSANAFVLIIAALALILSITHFRSGSSLRPVSGTNGSPVKMNGASVTDDANTSEQPAEQPQPKQKEKPAESAPQVPTFHAELHPPEVFKESPDACAQALQIPKVAIMFLTKGKLFHEPTWKTWLESAKGVLPLDVLGKAACGKNTAKNITEQLALCGTRKSGIKSQHLFNVYIHAPPSVKDSEVGKLFKGHLITHRVQTEWGQPSLIEATRNLMWEAYRDPLNQRFMLVSESDIPIWDPLTVYRQLMSEQQSRMTAWPHLEVDFRRYTWRMHETTAAIEPSMWRKSSQWFGLIRKHVGVVLEDEDVYRAFEQHCLWLEFDPDYQRVRDCSADEHYVPTLLAMKGLMQETVNSNAGVSAVDWSYGGEHPYAYSVHEITPALIQNKLRVSFECAAESIQDAQGDAQKLFVKIPKLEGPEKVESYCKVLKKRGDRMQYRAMPPTCCLTARKFGPETVGTVHKLFTSSDPTLKRSQQGKRKMENEGGEDEKKPED